MTTSLHATPPELAGRRVAPGVWMVWLLVGAGMTLTARNPLYSIILLMAARLVAGAAPAAGPLGHLPLLRLGIVVVAYSAGFNALFNHEGETVLVSLPSAWPLIGGALTLESVVFGAANGLLLIVLIAIFLAFNRLVPAHDLVRMLPAALRDLGLVILIAITYAPATAEHARRIREAQAIRGHRPAGWRSWRPLLVPLLIGGLERAASLAEAMVARGYAAPRAGLRSGFFRLALFLALGGLLLGWFLGVWVGSAGWWMLAVAAALLAALLLWSGRGRRRTSYVDRHWRPVDAVLAGLALLLLAFVLWPGTPGRESLTFSPYPRVGWPPFEPLIGLACALLAVPAAQLVRART